MRTSVVPLLLALSLTACGSPESAQSPDHARPEPHTAEPHTAEPHTAEPAPAAPDAADDATDENAATPPTSAVPPTRTPPEGVKKETRTMEVIQNVVLQNRQSVRRCYDLERQKDPSLRGTLTIHFKLDPKGNVAFAQVNTERSSLTHPQLARCAIEAIKKMKFPPSSRGFESAVNYPFDFRS